MLYGKARKLIGTVTFHNVFIFFAIANRLSPTPGRSRVSAGDAAASQ